MIEWQFEHFKTFTPYATMQQAAASLMLFEAPFVKVVVSKKVEK